MLGRIRGFVKCRHAYSVYNFSLHVRNVLRTESSGILVYNLAALGGPSRPRDRM